MLGHGLTLPLTFHQTSGLFSGAAAPFHTPRAVCEGSNFPTSLTALVTVCLSDYGHPSGCEVVSYWGADLRFLESLALCPAPQRIHSCSVWAPPTGRFAPGMLFWKKRASCILVVCSEITEVTSWHSYTLKPEVIVCNHLAPS